MDVSTIYNMKQNTLIPLKISCAPPTLPSLPPLNLWQPVVSLLSLIVLLFQNVI